MVCHHCASALLTPLSCGTLCNNRITLSPVARVDCATAIASSLFPVLRLSVIRPVFFPVLICASLPVAPFFSSAELELLHALDLNFWDGFTVHDLLMFNWKRSVKLNHPSVSCSYNHLPRSSSWSHPFLSYCLLVFSNSH